MTRDNRIVGHSPVNFTDIITDSPLQRLQSRFLDDANIQLHIKRDDLIHPDFGGNKWRKLKYNLIYAREQGHDTLLTFGGAWSNHIYATAAAGHHFGFNTIGIIRGEKHSPLNATLADAENWGMQLHYINRSQYREKDQGAFLDKIRRQFGHVYILPEGGSNSLAVSGCHEIVSEIDAELDTPFDIICCASGTGATLAGIIQGMDTGENTRNRMAIGFSSLKGGKFLANEVSRFLCKKNAGSNWHIESGFHFGGYARINDELVNFMHAFDTQYGIPLDAVYTTKMFYGLFELIKSGAIKPDSVIVAVHSGGIQGNRGMRL